MPTTRSSRLTFEFDCIEPAGYEGDTVKKPLVSAEEANKLLRERLPGGSEETDECCGEGCCDHVGTMEDRGETEVALRWLSRAHHG